MTEEEKEQLKQFQKSWARNKYWVMSRSQQGYNRVRLLAKGNEWSLSKQKEYEEILKSLEEIEPTKKTLKVAYEHIWGYFKKKATLEEKSVYKQLINGSDYLDYELENFLRELSKKYQQTYLLNMRWCLTKES